MSQIAPFSDLVQTTARPGEPANGRTALRVALEELAWAVSPEWIKPLLSSASAVASEAQGLEPLLSIACQLSTKCVVETLMGHCDPNLSGQHGETPLMKAWERQSHPNVIEFLARASDLLKTDDVGRTAIVRALSSPSGPDAKTVDRVLSTMPNDQFFIEGPKVFAWVVDHAMGSGKKTPGATPRAVHARLGQLFPLSRDRLLALDENMELAETVRPHEGLIAKNHPDPSAESPLAPKPRRI